MAGTPGIQVATALTPQLALAYDRRVNQATPFRLLFINGHRRSHCQHPFSQPRAVLLGKMQLEFVHAALDLVRNRVLLIRSRLGTQTCFPLRSPVHPTALPAYSCSQELLFSLKAPIHCVSVHHMIEAGFDLEDIKQLEAIRSDFLAVLIRRVMASNTRQRDHRYQWGVPPPSAADPRKQVESPRWRGDSYGKRGRDDEDALFRGRRGYGLLHESSTSSRSSSGVDDDVEHERRAFVDDTRLYGGDDIGGGDPEEDDLMRMIMEKEQQEAESASAAIRGDRMHFQTRNGRNRMTAAAVMDDFFSPMRPPSAMENAHRMHPFRNMRASATTEKHDRRHDNTTERTTRVSRNRQHSQQYGDGSDVTSNQIEHERPSLSQEGRPPAQQQQTRDRRRSQKSEKERMVDANALWEEYINGNMMTTQSARHQPYSAPLPNGFHEEISLSRPNSMEEFLRPASSPLHDVMPSDGKRQRGRFMHEDHEGRPAGKFSNESIPEVSYSPPMSSAMHSSSSRSRKSHSGAYQRSRGEGTSDDTSRRRSSAQSGSPNVDENDRDDEHLDGDDRDRNPHFVQQQQNAVFPFWSVAFLLSCLLVGIAGFFVEDVMNAIGKVTKTSPATPPLSRETQQQMHNRLEQLQTEIHGFRHTASEIEGHSQRVFEEVKAHLARMKHEREKQQEMIENEMYELRTHMLQMMNEMVDQERELIQRRVKATVDARVQDVDQRIHDTFRETSTNANGVPTERAETVPLAEQHDGNESKTVDPNPVDEKNAIATDEAKEVEAVKSAALSTGESVMLLSWELLLLLTGISILGGLVGLRVQNLNRRKRWFEQRKIRRQIQARLEQERAARLAEQEEDDDDEDSEDETIELDDDDDDDDDKNGDTADSNNVVEDWDDAATESSIETVSLMRRASEDLAESSNQRLSSGESDNDGESNDEEGQAATQKKSTADTTEGTLFVLDVFSAQDEARGDDAAADDAGATADGDGDGGDCGAAPETITSAAAAANGDHINGRQVVEEIGMVSAAAVRSKSVFSDMYVALAGLIGGEAHSYTALMNETMEEAVHRMQFAAQSQGATAIVNVRFDTNTTMNRLVFGLHCSVVCYGTAVRCVPVVAPPSSAIH